MNLRAHNHEQRLIEAFQPSGGLIAGDAMALRLRSRCEQPVSMLARRIVGREVVHIAAGGDIQLPLFQFDPADLSVRVTVRRVIAVLAPVFDDKEIASWFAEPNRWLQGERPADAVLADAPAVLRAARADCFVACGG
jgi:hypothetical protein